MGGFLPVNLLMAAIFLFGIAWGWDGEAERQFFAIVSSIFMLSVWLAPLFNIVDDGTCCTLVSINGWLPTALLENILFWNVVLMYFTGAHFMASLERDEPMAKLIRRLRKKG